MEGGASSGGGNKKNDENEQPVLPPQENGPLPPPPVAEIGTTDSSSRHHRGNSNSNSNSNSNTGENNALAAAPRGPRDFKSDPDNNNNDDAVMEERGGGGGGAGAAGGGAGGGIDNEGFLERLRHYYASHAPGGVVPPIDHRRAYYLLEASAFNVELAVALYWDDLSGVCISDNEDDPQQPNPQASPTSGNKPNDDSPDSERPSGSDEPTRKRTRLGAASTTDDPSHLLWGGDIATSLPEAWVEASFGRIDADVQACHDNADDNGNANANHDKTRNRDSDDHDVDHGLLHHDCVGVAALKTVVRALLQAGTSVQGKVVSHRGTRRPTTLVDALTCLLLVAAKAARRRKCSVGRWESVLADDDNSIHLIEHSHRRLATSLTHIDDLRSYVCSHLRSFRAPGGCALFMETLVRIHGTARLGQALGRRRWLDCRGDNDENDNDDVMLCDPHENDPTKQKDNKRPYGVGVEFLSLLLTGHVHTSYRDWDTGGLGIGVLTPAGSHQTLSPRLLHPPVPVWVVVPDDDLDPCVDDNAMDANPDDNYNNNNNNNNTRHHCSVLWVMNPEKAVICGNGSSFRVQHWTSRGTHNSGGDANNNTRVHTLRVVTAATVPTETGSEASPPIGRSLLEHVRHDEEDETLYPEQYHRWRFQLPSVPTNDDHDHDSSHNHHHQDNVTMEEDTVAPWIPYYRLTNIQKRLVDFKYAPSVHMFVWSRWPGAMITSQA